MPASSADLISPRSSAKASTAWVVAKTNDIRGLFPLDQRLVDPAQNPLPLRAPGKPDYHVLIGRAPPKLWAGRVAL